VLKRWLKFQKIHKSIPVPTHLCREDAQESVCYQLRITGLNGVEML
jgi:hypothetical protein